MIGPSHPSNIFCHFYLFFFKKITRSFQVGQNFVKKTSKAPSPADGLDKHIPAHLMTPVDNFLD